MSWLCPRPSRPRNFTRDPARHVWKADIPAIGLHGPRHTHLSHLMADGVPVNLVSERAGHASAKMTLDIYGHVLPGMQENVTHRVGANLRDMLKG